MKKLHEKVYELVGEASMCWSETPSGVFDADRAMLLADKFVLELEKEAKQIYPENCYGHFVLCKALKELEGGEK